MEKENLLKIIELLKEMGYKLSGFRTNNDELQINAEKLES